MRLLEQPCTVAELVVASGRFRPTVSRALGKLTQHGMARKVGEAWEGIAATVERLDAIAQQCGTAGKGIAQVEKHREERSIRYALD
jgi:hypothetical protein